MDYQYGQPDRRPFMAGGTHFPAFPQPSEPYLINPNLTLIPQPRPQAPASPSTYGFQMEANDLNNGRWPRQETLTLLEIRSRLHNNFKEATHKGPLWDEVSRIMREEHAYQRSGKKCREKFENLYKYYKKTKEGKIGRQDGRHYRFFRQLDALCGEANNSETHLLQSNVLYPTEGLSLSNSSEIENSSSENNDLDLSGIDLMMNTSSEKKKKKKRVSKRWTDKMEELVESHMEEIIDKQEALMQKMLCNIENKEHVRAIRDEEWRKQEAARFDQEYEMLAKERACIKARDKALVVTLHNLTSEDPNALITQETEDPKTNYMEPEISCLIQLRTSMEPKFQECGYFRESLWEEVAAKMGLLGYDVSAGRCKETWDNISTFFGKPMELNKNSRSSNCFKPLPSYNAQQFVKQATEVIGIERSENDISPVNSNAAYIAWELFSEPGE